MGMKHTIVMRNLRRKDISLDLSRAFWRFQTRVFSQECMNFLSKWCSQQICHHLWPSRTNTRKKSQKLKSNTTLRPFCIRTTSMTRWSISKCLSSENQHTSTKKEKSRRRGQISRLVAASIKATLKCGVHSTRTSSHLMKLPKLQSMWTTVSASSRSQKSAFSSSRNSNSNMVIIMRP